MASFAVATPRMTKADVVYEELRRQLVSGERPAGQTFSTYDLARQFDVSRRPVMDAVMRLETAGFIEIVGQVGCRVVVPSTEDLLDHMDVTGALGGAAGQFAAERATPEQIATIESLCEQLEVATLAEDADDFDRLNVEFHNAITAASGNRRLQSLVAEAWDISQFFRYLRDRSDLRMLQDEHRAVVEAIKRGDGRLARDILEQHNSHAKTRVGGRSQVGAACQGTSPTEVAAASSR